MRTPCDGIGLAPFRRVLDLARNAFDQLHLLERSDERLI